MQYFAKNFPGDKWQVIFDKGKPIWSSTDNSKSNFEYLNKVHENDAGKPISRLLEEFGAKNLPARVEAWIRPILKKLMPAYDFSLQSEHVSMVVDKHRMYIKPQLLHVDESSSIGKLGHVNILINFLQNEKEVSFIKYIYLYR